MMFHVLPVFSLCTATYKYTLENVRKCNNIIIFTIYIGYLTIENDQTIVHCWQNLITNSGENLKKIAITC